MTISAIYAGDVVHARHRPRRHRLHYRVFSLLLDLDELPALARGSRLLGHNRAAIFSFWDKDHGDGGTGTLRPWVEARLCEAGLDLFRPRIAVLCYPRIFGYVFNPLTLYFCTDGSGTLRAVLYEVCNTYGERHTYVIPAAPGAGRLVRQRAEKRHFVSPFMPMHCTYDFAIRPPAESVLVRIDESDADGPLLLASFAATRRPLTDAGPAAAEDEGWIALDAALERLAALSPRKARIVELRFFAGMTHEEIAAALGVSEPSVRREWRLARAWLRDELDEVHGP